jgi:hypothetical protein
MYQLCGVEADNNVLDEITINRINPFVIDEEPTVKSKVSINLSSEDEGTYPVLMVELPL